MQSPNLGLPSETIRGLRSLGAQIDRIEARLRDPESQLSGTTWMWEQAKLACLWAAMDRLLPW